jgi:hypothetical protein
VAVIEPASGPPETRVGQARTDVPIGSIEIEIGRARVEVRGQVEAEQLRVVLEALYAHR